MKPEFITIAGAEYELRRVPDSSPPGLVELTKLAPDGKTYLVHPKLGTCNCPQGRLLRHHGACKHLLSLTNPQDTVAGHRLTDREPNCEDPTMQP